MLNFNPFSTAGQRYSCLAVWCDSGTNIREIEVMFTYDSDASFLESHSYVDRWRSVFLSKFRRGYEE